MHTQHKDGKRDAFGLRFLKAVAQKARKSAQSRKPGPLIGLEQGGRQSAACGSPRCRAYPPQRSCGRVAEGGGLLNRYRVVKPYRGFESLRLRQYPLNAAVLL